MLRTNTPVRVTYFLNFLKPNKRRSILTVCGILLVPSLSAISEGSNLTFSLSSRLTAEATRVSFTDQFGSVQPQHQGNHFLLVNLRLTNTITPELVFEEGLLESIALSINRFHLLWGGKRFDVNPQLSATQSGHLRNPVRLKYSGTSKQGYLVFEVPLGVPDSANLVFQDHEIGSFIVNVLTDSLGREIGSSPSVATNIKENPSTKSHSYSTELGDLNSLTRTEPNRLTMVHGQIDFELTYQTGDLELAPRGTQFPESAERITLTLDSQLDHSVQAEVRWFAVNVEGIETNKRFYKQKRKLFPKGHKRSKTVFSIKAKGGWQRLGTYRAEIAINDRVIHSQPFSVITDIPTPALQLSANREMGFNVALAALGGQSRYVTGNGSDNQVPENSRWQLSNLIDGAPYFAKDPSKFDRCFRCGWKWPTKRLPVELDFSFHDGKAPLISTVIIDTRTIVKGNITAPKHVEVWLSDENAVAVFHKVASVRLARIAAQHTITFQPTRASIVKLRVLSAHDHGSTKNLAISEVAIIESPQQQPSIVEAVKKNIAFSGSGGGISRFSSHWLKEKGGVAQLIDGSDETPGWRTHLDQLPQEIIFSFRENREAWIDFLSIRKNTQHDSATWPKRISIETSSTSPVSDFRPIGEFVLPRTTAEWTTPIQGAARYVKMKILENHGGPYTSLGEVRVVEGQASDYRSVLFGAPTEAEKLAVSSLPRSVWPEQEPNGVPAKATAVPLGESFGGIIENSSDRDLYSFVVPGNRRMALAVDLTGVPYLSTLIQLKNISDEELRREEPQGRSTQNTSFSWNIDAGDYYLEITRPPVSVVLLWDGSGSMAGQTENLRAAVRAYLNTLGVDNHVNVARFAGADVVGFLDQFTNDPLKVWAVISDEFTAKGGTPLYKGIQKGIELLEGRSGNKAVILMTDGVDSKKRLPVFWETIVTSGVRFYTIGLGPDQDVFFQDRASNGRRLLADLSRASGGRHFAVHSSDELPAIYERIGRELQSPTHYQLTLRQIEETGGLTVIANRDTASDENTKTTSGRSKKDDNKEHLPSGEQLSKAAVYLEIIFDASGSMKIASGGESKITAAKRALKEVLKSLDSDHIALAFRAYGFDTSLEYGKATTCKNTELLVDFSEGSPSSISRAANPLQTYGHTPIAKSLRLAGKDLEPFKKQHPTILLISDGKDSCDGNPVAEIERLRARGLNVKVHIVGFDLDGAARSQLEDIANAGNGHYFDAENYRDLSDSLNRVAMTVNQDAKSARQEGNPEQAIVQQKIPIFDVLDAAGHRVAQGQIGDTISGLAPDTYTLLIHREEPPITIENVIVNAGEIAVVKP